MWAYHPRLSSLRAGVGLLLGDLLWHLGQAASWHPIEMGLPLWNARALVPACWGWATTWDLLPQLEHEPLFSCHDTPPSGPTLLGWVGDGSMCAGVGQLSRTCCRITNKQLFSHPNVLSMWVYPLKMCGVSSKHAGTGQPPGTCCRITDKQLFHI